MYSIVKRLRKDGARLHIRDIERDPGHVGHLTLAFTVNDPILRLTAPGGIGTQDRLIPELHNARVTSMGADMQLWEGDEFVSGDAKGKVVKQEWSVRLAVDPPADIPPPSRRQG